MAAVSSAHSVPCIKPGTAVLTQYGVGVVVSENNDRYGVLLWRAPGKSVGSAARSTLQASAILQELPAAPGMMAKLQRAPDTEATNVLVVAYLSDTKSYLVSEIDKTSVDVSTAPESPSQQASQRQKSPAASPTNSAPVALMRVSVEQVLPSAAAKFYPALEALMRRADQTASATAQLITSGKTKRIVETTTRQLASVTGNQLAHLEKNGASLQDLSSMAEAELPRATQSLKEMLKLIKNEDLATLLEESKARLEQLVHVDLPEATQQALRRTGIRIQADIYGASSFSESIYSSRKAALTSVEDLLRKIELDQVEWQNMREDVVKTFATTFDLLSTAAKSDRSLNGLFEAIVEKTSEWQEATGRVLQTRSASLFLEGAGRLHARAAAILGQQRTEWVGEIGIKLTKAFTEGDAALAKLKTIELGDLLKSRLVQAIEVRSDSLGGLDGIIAAALTTVRGRSGTGDQVKAVLTNLQSSASSATKNAHETLISVLSRRSEYRDVALLRIERVLCGLEGQFGSELDPQDIASIARGEGGTAKLFEPIARRAMIEINNQLSIAETQISDRTALDMLKRVRAIISGDMSLTAITDEIVNILNDEKVVAVGETFVQQSEHILDAIEGVSGNAAVNDALQIAKKAGVTTDSVMREIERLDVTQLLDRAGQAVSDETARSQLVSSATDVALDFLLRILPSMPVPPFEGAKDGLIYRIANLSMKGFKVRKENISIKLAGMRATTSNESTNTENEYREDDVMGDPDDQNGSSSDSLDTAPVVEADVIPEKVKATEVLIIDVRHISAELDDADWSFEQTYLPYLKGNGTANVTLSEGAIRLQFELRRSRVTGSDGLDCWKPMLCLHTRSCSIGNVSLSFAGEGKITWIINKLAGVFQGPLRDYVVRTILRVLTNRSGWILEQLNLVLAPYWDIILRTTKLKLSDLEKADDKVVARPTIDVDKKVVELVWRDRNPLGMNLLMNDKSGRLKVVDFPRGSQARLVCERRKFDPNFFKGSTIVAVNGSEYEDQDELFDALRDLSRPKTIRFEIAESNDAEKMLQFVEGKKHNGIEPEATPDRHFLLIDVDFEEPDKLGIDFSPSFDNIGLIVAGFIEGSGGTVLAAERSGKIKVGNLLTHVNGQQVIGPRLSGRLRAIQLLESVGDRRPLRLTFSDQYIYREVIEKPAAEHNLNKGIGPAELVLGDRLGEKGRRITIQSVRLVPGIAETCGLLIGDHLAFVNAIPVGVGCRWIGESSFPSREEVNKLIADDRNYPIGLTFARPKQSSGRWTTRSDFDDSDAETICVTATSKEWLGIVLDQTPEHDVVIKDFTEVPGVFKRILSKYEDGVGRLHLSIDSINGQFVPTYASRAMMLSALNLCWRKDQPLEIWLCDDDRRDWIQSIIGETERTHMHQS